MAIGFSPQHIQDIALHEQSAEHYLTLAIKSALALGWNVRYISANGFIAYTKPSMSSWSEEVTVKLQGHNVIIKSESTGSQFIDWGKNKKNTDLLLEKIQLLKAEVSHEELLQTWETLKPNFVPPEEDLLILPPPTFKQNAQGFLSFFVPREGYFITPIVVNLNLLIFIVMVASGVHFMEPTSQSLIEWGANFKPVTLNGEWWRLISCCFLHIGIFHLLMNMYALVYIGLLLEPYLGKTRFAAAYLLTGLTASLASLWWHDQTVSAGASGAIFGMYGVFLAMLTSNLIEKEERQSLLTSIAIFVGYNLLNGLRGGIDNAAHIGGLMGGLVIGYAYLPGLKTPASSLYKYGVVTILSVATIVVTFFVYRSLPNDLLTYEKQINQFMENEQEALKIFDEAGQLPEDSLLISVQHGIAKWEENIRLTEEMSSLKLSDHLQERNKDLGTYAEWRLKSFRIMARSFKEDIVGYQDSIKLYNGEIESVLKKLNTPE